LRLDDRREEDAHEGMLCHTEFMRIECSNYEMHVVTALRYSITFRTLRRA
jgi:hypothetical protein